MSDITFYHIEPNSHIDFAISFVSGLEKQNQRAVIFAEDKEFLHSLDNKLWTFASEMFIPHCLAEDNLPIENQNFYLISKINYLSTFNTIIIFTNDNFDKNKKLILEAKNYEKIYCIFDGIESNENYHKIIKAIEGNTRFFIKNNQSWEMMK